MPNSTNDSILAEVIAASIGGSFSASALYPLEVLKTKLQAESKQSPPPPPSPPQSQQEESSSSSEDLLLIPQSAPPNSSSSCSDSSSASKPPPPPPPTPPSAITYAKNLYEREGLSPFYAGIGTSAFQSATEKALYFFAYTGLKNGYISLVAGEDGAQRSMGTLVNLIIGYLSEWAHLPVTLPIDCLTTKIQTSQNTTATGKNEGPIAILCTMLASEGGIRGMYKGIQAYTVLCLKPAIQYTAFEQIKEIVLQNRRGGHERGRRGRETLSAPEAFFLGMVARTVATVVVFPYLRAKVMLQSSSQGDGGGEGREKGEEKVSIPAMVAKMYNDGGLEEIFRGIGPELTRGVLSAALMLMVKEKIGFVVHSTFRKG